MSSTLVFVFGTLRQGFPNSRTNTGIRVPGLFVTVSAYPFHLVGERHSPWLVNQPGHGLHVVGELFEVDALLRREEIRAGPLREYTLAHAALYSPR